MSASVASLPYDGHVHTVASDGRDTLSECVRAAEATGLRCVAITDHFYHQPGANPADWARAAMQADAASAVAVVPGAEVVILNPDGDLSISREEARYFRWIIADLSTQTAGVGREVPATVQRFLENVERALVKAAANPLLDAIAHPFNLGRWEAKLNPEDLPEDMLGRIAEAMSANECAYELSAQAWWWHPDISVDEYLRQITPVLRIFSQAGVYFAVGSDAHSACGVGNLSFVSRMMRAAGITRDQLIDLETLNERRRHEQAKGKRLA